MVRLIKNVSGKRLELNISGVKLTLQKGEVYSLSRYQLEYRVKNVTSIAGFEKGLQEIVDAGLVTIREEGEPEFCIADISCWLNKTPEQLAVVLTSSDKYTRDLARLIYNKLYRIT